jgi:hypothetical protein
MENRVTLPSGLTVELKLPPLYHILSKVSILPNPYLQHIVQHLSSGPSDFEDDMMSNVNHILMLYEVFALCVVNPAVSLQNSAILPDGRKEGTLYQDEIHFDDLLAVYHWFRRGTKIFFTASPDNDDTEYGGFGSEGGEVE